MKSDETEEPCTSRAIQMPDEKTGLFFHKEEEFTAFDVFDEFIADVCQDLYTHLCNDHSNMKNEKGSNKTTSNKGE